MDMATIGGAGYSFGLAQEQQRVQAESQQKLALEKQQEDINRLKILSEQSEAQQDQKSSIAMQKLGAVFSQPGNKDTELQKLMMTRDAVLKSGDAKKAIQLSEYVTKEQERMTQNRAIDAQKDLALSERLTAESFNEQLRMAQLSEKALHDAEIAQGKKDAAAKKAEEAKISQEELESAGGEIATGTPLTQVISGYGPSVANKREQARMEAVKQIQATTAFDAKQAGHELALRQQEYKSFSSSDRQLNVMQRATEQAVTQLDFHINKTDKLMAQLGHSDISPVISAIQSGYDKWTGDPRYADLFYNLSGAAIEAARIRNGGQASIAQLHQGAAEEAKHWADIGMTPASWKAVSESMKQEGRVKIESYRDTRRNQREGVAGGESNKTPTTTASGAKVSNW